ncbi:FG-GAP repeat domain-containing protein [Microbacterium murale]|uniref:VCBS repeat protein n=1 Tax=Microbacterium murale TaxID=1081040 RepID=A0ABU0PDL8_9MICO|nr:VCBS repeat-containing protein [Microbacterium murale]MDQ0645022.1 hypothetical protein [Microbacterium murale]
MSRRAPRSRNVLRIARFLTVLVAVTAVVLGTVAPVTLATASASLSTSANLARTSGDAAQTGIAKASLAGFNPGSLISDAVFTNKSTMTEAQIQSFFNGKVSQCQSGYTCLKDFRISSVNRPADAYCSGYTGAANETAARIIYRVAQACNINPQVLIVMLQKEQGLITHTWPSSWRYDMALGQGCPDTAPCDPNFVGFFHQIFGAARQMQIYMEGKWFQWYAPGNTWNLRYHPNESCGSSPVYIANKATSAMYYYTPYQPNAAALAAGYGEANNSCSSYGNRNFYNYFTDWFGSTQTTPPPPAPRPVLTSSDTSAYVVGADASGTVWGYPFGQSLWGDRVQLAKGLGALTAFFGVGDLDGDGHRDFIAMGADRRVSLLRGDGSKTLSAATPAPGDWANVTAVVPAGDFDGDGLADVFTTDAGGNLYLRSADNRGGFRPAVRVGVGWSGMNHLIGGIDMDGDGKSDLVARDTAGNLYLYPGSGTGGWGARVQIGNGWSPMKSIFSPGDFTGDGNADLLAHGADGNLMLFAGRGGGFLTAKGSVGNGWTALAVKGPSGAEVSKPRPLAAGFGNIDGVAGNDVVALTGSGNVRIYGGNGKGGWSKVTDFASGWAATDDVISMGDFTGDGHRDIGRLDSAGKFQLYAGRSGGAFAGPVQIGNGWGGFARVIGGIDFDGDRLTDVLAVTADGRMILYRGNGSGGWSGGSGAQVGNGWGIVDTIINAGDFDGDGYVDLMARLPDGTLRLYPTNGRGVFLTPQQIGNGWGVMKSIFSPGDFNGDGTNDLIGVAKDGAMFLYPGNGQSRFGDRTQIGNGWQSMAYVG